ncbi:putative TIM-barrel protein, nifR3 family [Paucidesulfovibrio gracilis DSM 16080]|uniref:tRNA-dihydrouridine synthase n=1 Tax=Paucidesulfovibrio gracilis DSM 16080 TaxID=1121449 RepID=A0A1T4W5K4_9BACT|nr:tRNA-dihydrouridine synthase family protein [Paucidesulfovibrio gracilis]SKA72419.1 putative TIM-barrel protein, nifR3 family [Paucidesulfovibrio gracilis DSM 16080]
MNENEWERLRRLLHRPLSLRGRVAGNRLWLAPMAGLGHVALRSVIDDLGGCGLLFSEMCTARGLDTENRRSSPTFRWRDAEAQRLVVQISGGDPGEMAAAAGRIAREGLCGVDVNMGCSATALTKRGAGAALLREPERAFAVVRAVRQAVDRVNPDLPVLVKFRTGWQPDPEPACEMARVLVEAGADALVFHPRVAPDRRTRPAVWEHIGLVAGAVDVPVLGNGDVQTPGDCLRMLEETGCAGVSVGRMAVARPWLFASWTLGREFGPSVYRETALAVLNALERYFDPQRAVKRYRKFAVYLAANFRYGHALVSQLTRGASLNDFRNSVHTLLCDDLPLSHRPSTHLFTR